MKKPKTAITYECDITANTLVHYLALLMKRTGQVDSDNQAEFELIRDGLVAIGARIAALENQLAALTTPTDADEVTLTKNGAQAVDEIPDPTPKFPLRATKFTRELQVGDKVLTTSRRDFTVLYNGLFDDQPANNPYHVKQEKLTHIVRFSDGTGWAYTPLTAYDRQWTMANWVDKRPTPVDKLGRAKACASELQEGDKVVDKHYTRERRTVTVVAVVQDIQWPGYQRIEFSDGSGWSFIPGGHYDTPQWERAGQGGIRTADTPTLKRASELTVGQVVRSDDPTAYELDLNHPARIERINDDAANSVIYFDNVTWYFTPGGEWDKPIWEVLDA